MLTLASRHYKLVDHFEKGEKQPDGCSPIAVNFMPHNEVAELETGQTLIIHSDFQAKLLGRNGFFPTPQAPITTVFIRIPMRTKTQLDFFPIKTNGRPEFGKVDSTSNGYGQTANLNLVLP